MPTPRVSLFQAYEFSDEEKLAMQEPPAMFKLYLHNRRVEIATQILNLEVNPVVTLEFAVRHAHLTGKLEILNELIGD